MSLRDLIERRSLIVCVGPGGVGKTTVSAALGMAGARLGRRTLVLTIDPARRLADALGLHELDDEIQRVPIDAELVARGISGQLDAAMVDTARSYASLIERITADSATKQRILDNKVFHAVSRSMARSHAYVAMERLYDAVFNRAYDLVVLDTPPARNALDIMDAPHQLARFLDSRFVEWFMPPGGRRGLRDRILATGGDVAKRFLGMITGDQLLTEIVGFLEAFASLREGFIDRAQRVDALLRARESAFVLVSSASPASADDAVWLRHDLQRRNVPMDAVVFNQSYIPIDPREPQRRHVARPVDSIDATWSRLAPHFVGSHPQAGVLSAIRALRVEASRENERFDHIVAGVEAELDPDCRRVRTPRFDDEIRDLPGLLALADVLLR